MFGCDPVQRDEQPGGGGEPVEMQSRVPERANVVAIEAADEGGCERSGSGGVRMREQVPGGVCCTPSDLTAWVPKCAPQHYRDRVTGVRRRNRHVWVAVSYPVIQQPGQSGGGVAGLA